MALFYIKQSYKYSMSNHFPDRGPQVFINWSWNSTVMFTLLYYPIVRNKNKTGPHKICIKSVWVY